MATVTTSDGTTINYTDHGGTGRPVLLVHGITESAASWDPVAERLVSTDRVIAMDLRGHGESGVADRYDLDVMASDVAALVNELGLAGQVHLVGHSLGGAVVSAAGAAVPVASVVDVDQSLQLGGFKDQLGQVEAMLRDVATFRAVIDGMFGQMAGELIGADAMDRVHGLRRPDQDVVLGVWDVLFSKTEDEIDQVVAKALAGLWRSISALPGFVRHRPGPRLRRLDSSVHRRRSGRGVGRPWPLSPSGRPRPVRGAALRLLGERNALKVLPR